MHRPRLDYSRIQQRVPQPHITWKYKHMLRKMVVPRERIVEESEDSEDTASIGDIGESSPSIPSPDSGILSTDIPPSPAHTRS